MKATQAQTDCIQETFGFQAIGKRKVEADFSGGHLSSDGGVLLVGEVDKRLRLTDQLCSCFIRKRFGKHVRIIVRADSGFCRDELLTWIESQPNIHYCVGPARNKRLEKMLEPAFEETLKKLDYFQLAESAIEAGADKLPEIRRTGRQRAELRRAKIQNPGQLEPGTAGYRQSRNNQREKEPAIHRYRPDRKRKMDKESRKQNAI